ncbi:MAG: lipase family protein [Candidatus Kariarchaeaceae archaeon]|jgi:hypothetical protein
MGISEFVKSFVWITIKTRKDVLALLFVTSALTVLVGSLTDSIEEYEEIEAVLVTYFGVIGAIYAADKGEPQRHTLGVRNRQVRIIILIIAAIGWLEGSPEAIDRLFLEIGGIALARFVNVDVLHTKDEWNLTEITKEDIIDAANASNHVYSDEKKWDIEELGYSKLKGMKEGGKTKTDTEGFIGKKGKTIFIVFRGTAGFKDVLLDLNIFIRTEPGCEKKSWWRDFKLFFFMRPSKVHRGFNAARCSIWKSLTDILLGDPVTKSKAWIDDDVDKVIVTGHSLGGAVATLAASALANELKHKPNIKIGLVTFGAPRPGNVVFAKKVERALKNRIHRFVNVGDPTPHVPFGIFRTWKHAGPSKLVNENCDPDPNELEFSSFEFIFKLLEKQVSSIKDELEPLASDTDRTSKIINLLQKDIKGLSIPNHSMEDFYLKYVKNCLK